MLKLIVNHKNMSDNYNHIILNQYKNLHCIFIIYTSLCILYFLILLDMASTSAQEIQSVTGDLHNVSPLKQTIFFLMLYFSKRTPFPQSESLGLSYMASSRPQKMTGKSVTNADLLKSIFKMNFKLCISCTFLIKMF